MRHRSRGTAQMVVALRHDFNNFGSGDLPLVDKLRPAAKTNAIEIKNRSTCYGSRSEPGG